MSGHAGIAYEREQTADCYGVAVTDPTRFDPHPHVACAWFGHLSRNKTEGPAGLLHLDISAFHRTSSSGLSENPPVEVSWMPAVRH